MADFIDHIHQAKKNLSFLAITNSQRIEFWDWQIAISFYSAVHLVNGFLAKEKNLHHRSHEEVKNSLNPFSHFPICPLPEEIYLSYAKLECLSRRARYLCSHEPENKDHGAYFTYDKHFAKAIRHLDKIIEHFNIAYTLGINNIELYCPDLSKAEGLKVFVVKK